nr:hypothetical protein L203_01515 [Cryptococcus depauperatus CBS 7841]
MFYVQTTVQPARLFVNIRRLGVISVDEKERFIGRFPSIWRSAIHRKHYSGASTSSVRDILKRMDELNTRVSAENSKTRKQRIIAEYPELRQLLEFVYNPEHRMFLSSAALTTYISKLLPSAPASVPSPVTLVDLFDLLSTRRVTGNKAKETARVFLQREMVLDDKRLTDVFGKLLDRNLASGFGAKTLKDVPWTSPSERLVATPLIPASPAEESHLSSNVLQAKQPSSIPSLSRSGETTPILPGFGSLDKFEVSLGKSITPPFSSLFKSPHDIWYASRKLDGVRCLTFLDFFCPFKESTAGSSITPQLFSSHCVSRSGNPFLSLSRLQSQLSYLASFPPLSEWLSRDSTNIAATTTGCIKRLVLDGEVCLMRPKTPEEIEKAQPRDDGSSKSLSDSMWIAGDRFIEDFSGTVSAVRRQGTIEHLSYFLFDVLSWGEVSTKGALPSPLGKSFSQRIEDVSSLGQWLDDTLEKQGISKENRIVRDLVQVQVKKEEDVEEMVERAANEGWEGLIFRKDNVYKGKRSTDIRKFKKWQDAEYTVESFDTSNMRLAVSGTFSEYKALSNIWISHKGHPVSVGSGFTAQQRLRWVEHPEEILGKVVTVEFFEECEAQDRKGKGDEGKSLRFPRIKAVWDKQREI